MKAITDELYTNLIKVLAEEPKVAIFQQLLLAEKIPDENEENPKEQKRGEK
ncbi:hypothetical protein [Treponema pectinovorum]|uniref:hypothetical protein n=1 Tax=Treponema pectinovorum TaxID=164 RepID=UPI00164D3B41|nr:hypothetical protein [Treponema pectinovorum]